MGCKTVYQMIKSKNLDTFYDINPAAGNVPTEEKERYELLDDRIFLTEFLRFENEQEQHAVFTIPSIHCSACIWILEQIDQFDSAIQSTTVHFSKKTIRIVYNYHKTSLRKIAELLAKLGYPPHLSVSKEKKIEPNRKLLLQIGIAGFAFGNAMFLSIATYFDSQEYWIIQFRPWFDLLMLIMSLPVLFFSAQNYFISAWKGIKSKIFSLDIPIAIGIGVLFLKSCVATFDPLQLSYFDSFTGLVFFLLIGKFMQEKTYSNFSYDRDYKSFFPIGVTKIFADKTRKKVPIATLEVGDQIALKVNELLPVDGVLSSQKTKLDYSFVTGEFEPIKTTKGKLVYAGGKIIEDNCTVTVLKRIQESNLVQLWSQNSFKSNDQKQLQSITDRLSRFFTPFILLFALGAGSVWAFLDPSKVLDVITAVLIVACPCALALSAPFISGNMMRYFDRLSFYIRTPQTLENLTKINHIVFDKTGTLTDPKRHSITYEGEKLNPKELKSLRSIFHQSNHPMSMALFNYMTNIPYETFVKCSHHTGKGLSATLGSKKYIIGSAAFVKRIRSLDPKTSEVHIVIDNRYRGCFNIQQFYLPKLKIFFKKLDGFKVSILSGDTSSELSFLESCVSKNTKLLFNQNPFQKIDYVKTLQDQGQSVLMIGDGLNDAGALQQSNLGISVMQKEHDFTPACDAILKGALMDQLPLFILYAKKSMQLIRISFVLSLFYNLIGLTIAALGLLQPMIAAILMPLSSISVVLFSYGATHLLYRRLKNRMKS